MKSKAITLLIVAFVSLSVAAHCEDERPFYAAAQQPPLSPAGLRALEHACKLVAAINALDWKTVESVMPPNGSFLPLLKRDATTLKEWGGVGAYRSSDLKQTDGTLIHRFAYGAGRTNPHEAWFHYSLRGDTFTLTGFSILGW